MATVPDTTRVWGGRTVAERMAERRASLLQATIDIVGESGASAVTTKAVCQRAGVAERRLYESFESRDALLLAAFDEAMARGTELLMAAFVAGSGATLVERIRNVLAAGVDVAVKDPALVRIVFVESVSDPVLRERSQMVHTTLEFLLIETLRDESLPHIVDPATAVFAVGGAISVFTRWLSGQLEMPREDFVEFAVETIVRLLGLDRAA